MNEFCICMRASMSDGECHCQMLVQLLARVQVQEHVLTTY